MMAATYLLLRAREAVRRRPPFQSAVAAYQRSRFLGSLRAGREPSQLGEKGRGDARAMMAASSLLQRAREAVRRQPPFQSALAAYQSGRFLDALRAWKEASQLGNAEADYRIGLLYEKGEGVRGSMPDAVLWYERAAAADHVEAQYKLGLIYRYGVPAQLGPTAHETWRRSCEKRLGKKLP